MSMTSVRGKCDDGTVYFGLPLLFSGGLPVSVEKMTVEQLEKFVPFMIDCLSKDPNYEGGKPVWWPKDVTFSFPLIRNCRRESKWLEILRKLVLNCYFECKCEFLLKFSGILAEFDPADLMTVEEDSTVSFYHTIMKKLLVSVRKETVVYDRKTQKVRKKLLLKNCADSEGMPSSFLPHLGSSGYEKVNGVNESQEENREEQPNTSDLLDLPNLTSGEDISSNKDKFLEYFQLRSPTSTEPQPSTRTQNGFKTIGNLFRYFSIPISSPLGQIVMQRPQASCTYLEAHLERLERYCTANPGDRSIIEFREPEGKWLVTWKNRKRPGLGGENDAQKKLKTSGSVAELLEQCRAVQVVLHRLTQREIDQCTNSGVSVFLKNRGSRNRSKMAKLRQLSSGKYPKNDSGTMEKKAESMPKLKDAKVVLEKLSPGELIKFTGPKTAGSASPEPTFSFTIDHACVNCLRFTIRRIGSDCHSVVQCCQVMHKTEWQTNATQTDCEENLGQKGKNTLEHDSCCEATRRTTRQTSATQTSPITVVDNEDCCDSGNSSLMDSGCAVSGFADSDLSGQNYGESKSTATRELINSGEKDALSSSGLGQLERCPPQQPSFLSSLLGKSTSCLITGDMEKIACGLINLNDLSLAEASDTSSTVVFPPHQCVNKTERPLPSSTGASASPPLAGGSSAKSSRARSPGNDLETGYITTRNCSPSTSSKRELRNSRKPVQELNQSIQEREVSRSFPQELRKRQSTVNTTSSSRPSKAMKITADDCSDDNIDVTSSIRTRRSLQLPHSSEQAGGKGKVAVEVNPTVPNQESQNSGSGESSLPCDKSHTETRNSQNVLTISTRKDAGVSTNSDHQKRNLSTQHCRVEMRGDGNERRSQNATVIQKQCIVMSSSSDSSFEIASMYGRFQRRTIEARESDAGNSTASEVERCFPSAVTTTTTTTTTSVRAHAVKVRSPLSQKRKRSAGRFVGNSNEKSALFGTTDVSELSSQAISTTTISGSTHTPTVSLPDIERGRKSLQTVPRGDPERNVCAVTPCTSSPSTSNHSNSVVSPVLGSTRFLRSYLRGSCKQPIAHEVEDGGPYSVTTDKLVVNTNDDLDVSPTDIGNMCQDETKREDSSSDMRFCISVSSDQVITLTKRGCVGTEATDFALLKKSGVLQKRKDTGTDMRDLTCPNGSEAEEGIIRSRKPGSGAAQRGQLTGTRGSTCSYGSDAEEEDGMKDMEKISFRTRSRQSQKSAIAELVDNQSSAKDLTLSKQSQKLTIAEAVDNWSLTKVSTRPRQSQMSTVDEAVDNQSLAKRMRRRQSQKSIINEVVDNQSLAKDSTHHRQSQKFNIANFVDNQSLAEDRTCSRQSQMSTVDDVVDNQSLAERLRSRQSQNSTIDEMAVSQSSVKDSTRSRVSQKCNIDEFVDNQSLTEGLQMSTVDEVVDNQSSTKDSQMSTIDEVVYSQSLAERLRSRQSQNSTIDELADRQSSTRSRQLKKLHIAELVDNQRSRKGLTHNRRSQKLNIAMIDNQNFTQDSQISAVDEVVYNQNLAERLRIRQSQNSTIDEMAVSQSSVKDSTRSKESRKCNIDEFVDNQSLTEDLQMSAVDEVVDNQSSTKDSTCSRQSQQFNRAEFVDIQNLTGNPHISAVDEVVYNQNLAERLRSRQSQNSTTDELADNQSSTRDSTQSRELKKLNVAELVDNQKLAKDLTRSRRSQKLNIAMTDYQNLTGDSHISAVDEVVYNQSLAERLRSRQSQNSTTDELTDNQSSTKDLTQSRRLKKLNVAELVDNQKLTKDLTRSRRSQKLNRAMVDNQSLNENSRKGGQSQKLNIGELVDNQKLTKDLARRRQSQISNVHEKVDDHSSSEDSRDPFLQSCWIVSSTDSLSSAEIKVQPLQKQKNSTVKTINLVQLHESGTEEIGEKNVSSRTRGSQPRRSYVSSQSSSELSSNPFLQSTWFINSADSSQHSSAEDHVNDDSNKSSKSKALVPLRITAGRRRRRQSESDSEPLTQLRVQVKSKAWHSEKSSKTSDGEKSSKISDGEKSSKTTDRKISSKTSDGEKSSKTLDGKRRKKSGSHSPASKSLLEQLGDYGAYWTPRPRVKVTFGENTQNNSLSSSGSVSPIRLVNARGRSPRVEQKNSGLSPDSVMKVSFERSKQRKSQLSSESVSPLQLFASRGRSPGVEQSNSFLSADTVTNVSFEGTNQKKLQSSPRSVSPIRLFASRGRSPRVLQTNSPAAADTDIYLSKSEESSSHQDMTTCLSPSKVVPPLRLFLRKSENGICVAKTKGSPDRSNRISLPEETSSSVVPLRRSRRLWGGPNSDQEDTEKNSKCGGSSGQSQPADKENDTQLEISALKSTDRSYEAINGDREEDQENAGGFLEECSNPVRSKNENAKAVVHGKNSRSWRKSYMEENLNSSLLQERNAASEDSPLRQENKGYVGKATHKDRGTESRNVRLEEPKARKLSSKTTTTAVEDEWVVSKGPLVRGNQSGSLGSTSFQVPSLQITLKNKKHENAMSKQPLNIKPLPVDSSRKEGDNAGDVFGVPKPLAVSSPAMRSNKSGDTVERRELRHRTPLQRSPPFGISFQNNLGVTLRRRENRCNLPALQRLRRSPSRICDFKSFSTFSDNVNVERRCRTTSKTRSVLNVSETHSTSSDSLVVNTSYTNIVTETFSVVSERRHSPRKGRSKEKQHTGTSAPVGEHNVSHSVIETQSGDFRVTSQRRKTTSNNAVSENAQLSPSPSSDSQTSDGVYPKALTTSSNTVRRQESSFQSTDARRTRSQATAPSVNPQNMNTEDTSERESRLSMNGNGTQQLRNYRRTRAAASYSSDNENHNGNVHARSSCSFADVGEQRPSRACAPRRSLPHTVTSYNDSFGGNCSTSWSNMASPPLSFNQEQGPHSRYSGQLATQTMTTTSYNNSVGGNFSATHGTENVFPASCVGDEQDFSWSHSSEPLPDTMMSPVDSLSGNLCATPMAEDSFSPSFVGDDQMHFHSHASRNMQYAPTSYISPDGGNPMTPAGISETFASPCVNDDPQLFHPYNLRSCMQQSATSFVGAVGPNCAVPYTTESLYSSPVMGCEQLGISPAYSQAADVNSPQMLPSHASPVTDNFGTPYPSSNCSPPLIINSGHVSSEHVNALSYLLEAYLSSSIEDM